MPPSKEHAAGSVPAGDEVKQVPGSAGEPAAYGHLAPDKIKQLARLIAGGEIKWPDDVTGDLADELTTAVRRHRRAELLRLVGKLIARGILSDRACEESTHVEENS